MDDLTKELVAIGASVTANCEPCLKYHVKMAREYGAGEESILASVEVGKMVKKGAMTKYNEFISSILGGTTTFADDSKAGCGGS